MRTHVNPIYNDRPGVLLDGRAVVHEHGVVGLGDIEYQKASCLQQRRSSQSYAPASAALRRDARALRAEFGSTVSPRAHRTSRKSFND